MTECPHGDDPNSCPPCQNPPRGRRLRNERSPGPRFTAAYASPCPGCPFGVEPGQDARRWDGRTWHARCAEVAAP